MRAVRGGSEEIKRGRKSEKPMQAEVVHQPRVEAHAPLERGRILGALRRLIERGAPVSAMRKLSRASRACCLPGVTPMMTMSALSLSHGVHAHAVVRPALVEIALGIGEPPLASKIRSRIILLANDT
jgi:hypothetical protein